MIEKRSVEECNCVKEPNWESQCGDLHNDLVDAHTKISNLERDKDVFISELSKVVTANQYLKNDLKWSNRICGEYREALFEIREIIERASDLNESDKEKILSIINKF
mgnify:CR=1 FL=1